MSRQYFEGVTVKVWNFHIVGCQLCEKWPKDPRGCALTYEDSEHYCKVVRALSETICLMAEIDAVIPKWAIDWIGRRREVDGTAESNKPKRDGPG